MTLAALLANLKPYDNRIHSVRGFSGAIKTASAIRNVLSGGDLINGNIKTKVQDAYSLRLSLIHI